MEAFRQCPINTVGLVFVDGSFVGGGDPAAAIHKAKDAVDRVGIDAFTERLFDDMFLEDSDVKLRERLVARATRAPSGHVAAVLPRSAMRSRRVIR
jgi:hypothetical protein